MDKSWTIFLYFNILLQSIIKGNLLSYRPYKIPLAFVESKIKVINFCQVSPLCLIYFVNSESTDVFRIKRY